MTENNRLNGSVIVKVAGNTGRQKRGENFSPQVFGYALDKQ